MRKGGGEAIPVPFTIELGNQRQRAVSEHFLTYLIFCSLYIHLDDHMLAILPKLRIISEKSMQGTLTGLE